MKRWNWTFVVLPVIAGAVVCAVTCCGSEQDASKDRLTLKYVECHQDSVGARRGNDSSCLVSRDGRHVYATRYGEDALLVYQRAASTGKLRLIQTIQNPTPVSLPSRMQESFDGRHLYVLGGMPDSLSIWSRDAESGKLNLVGALSSDMFTGVPGIRGTMAIALSPDDRNVYVAGNIDHSLVVFQRDATTGRLAPLQLFQDAGTSKPEPHTFQSMDVRWPSAIVLRGLRFPADLAVSHDGERVYVVCREVLLEFARDLPSGKLRFANAIWQPSGAVAVLGVWGSKQLAVSPDDRHVMTFGRRIGLFSRFPKASALVASGVQDTSAITAPSRPDWQRAVIRPDGKGLFVYGYQERAVDESKLGVFARHADDGTLVLLHWFGSEDPSVYTLADLSGLAISPDGRHVYAATPSHSVIVFAVHAAVTESTNEDPTTRTP